jgi:hypothetical protein
MKKSAFKFFFFFISDSNSLAVIEGNVLKLLRPLDREVQNEVRLDVYCIVTRTDDNDVTRSDDVINGHPQPEIIRSFRKAIIIQVEDVNDRVRIICWNYYYIIISMYYN